MQALFDGKPVLCTCLMSNLLSWVTEDFLQQTHPVYNDLISMITDLYGVADLFMQLKLSWVQFLKSLSLTDLDQDSTRAK